KRHEIFRERAVSLLKKVETPASTDGLIEALGDTNGLGPTKVSKAAFEALDARIDMLKGKEQALAKLLEKKRHEIFRERAVSLLKKVETPASTDGLIEALGD